MAMVLRDQNKLLALQLRLSAQTSGEVVSCSLFEGPQQLGATLDLPAAEFRLPRDCSEASMSDADLRLPQQLIDPLASAAARFLADGHPLWIYIPRGAGKLALFPWEEEIWRVMSRPLLRLPNFLEDPFEAGETLEIALAICQSPETEVRSASEQFEQFLAGLSGPNPPHRTIDVHVFAGSDCETDIARLARGFASETVNIEMHPAATARRVSEQPAGDGPDRRPASPWLRWMAERLHGRAIDLVHFICPAYSSEMSPCLALDQPALTAGNPLWGRLVAPQEIIWLLDQLGSNAVSFMPMGQGHWQRALSRFAFELSWRRPGPIIVLHPEAGKGRQAGALRLICGEPDFDFGLIRQTVFTCHPRYLLPARATGDRRAVFSPTGALDPTEIEETLVQIAQGKDADRSLLARSGTQGRPRGGSARQPASLSAATAAERMAGRFLRKSQAGLSGVEKTSRLQQWEQEGAAKAFDLVDQLLVESRRAATDDEGGQ